MFSVGSTVMYGDSGVCKIDDIRNEKFGDEEKSYYILKPLSNERLTIYCPVDCGPSRIRELLSAEEIKELINIMPQTETEWIDNDQKRKEYYHSVIKSGDHIELVRLVKTLYNERERRVGTGRKFHAVDEKIMKEAESVLFGEIAHVLEIRQDEVVPYIMGEIAQ